MRKGKKFTKIVLFEESPGRAFCTVKNSLCLNIVSLLILPVPMLDKDCLKFGNMEFEESESEWFQMYSGTF